MAVYNNSFIIQKQTGGENLLQEIVDNKPDLSYFFLNYEGDTVPLFDTSNVTNMSYMFNYSRQISTVPLFDTSNVTNMKSMFGYCYSLRTVPLFDTSKVTNMSQMFYNCTPLNTIPAFDTSNVTSMGGMFNNCPNIKSILMYGMKANFNISASTKFEREDLLTILNNLATVTSTTTLTMGSTNLAKLTEEDKAIATQKGWTLA